MKKGFSLIELMVVVAIFSVAAAILVPRFLKHQIQTKQEECHKNLRSLYSAEKEYFQRNGVYTHDLAMLGKDGWKPEGKSGHQFQFLPAPFPENGFLFQCVGNIDRDPTPDQATIDETGKITQVSDDYLK